MSRSHSLDQLEDEVLRRIASYRRNQTNRGGVPVSVVVTACALAAGLSVGAVRARTGGAHAGSETVVLADDASLAPSTLLTTSQ